MEVDRNVIEKEIARYNVENAYKDVPPIHETLAPAHISNFKHAETRGFDRYYCTDFTQQRNLDTCFTLQNRIGNQSVVGLLHLSHRHSIFREREQQRIKRIIFHQQQVQIGNHGSAIRNKFLTPNTLLCTIHMEDNTVYPVHVGARGTLVEVNPVLLENPNLIVEDPTSKGFLAIFVSSHTNHLQNLLTLKTKQEYDSMEIKQEFDSMETS